MEKKEKVECRAEQSCTRNACCRVGTMRMYLSHDLLPVCGDHFSRPNEYVVDIPVEYDVCLGVA